MGKLESFSKSCFADMAEAFRFFPWAAAALCLLTLPANALIGRPRFRFHGDAALVAGNIALFCLYAALAGMAAGGLRDRLRERTARLPDTVLQGLFALALACLALACGHLSDAARGETLRTIRIVAVCALLGLFALIALCREGAAGMNALADAFAPAAALFGLWQIILGVFALTFFFLFDAHRMVDRLYPHLSIFLGLAAALLFLGRAGQGLAAGPEAAGRIRRSLFYRLLYGSAAAYAAVLLLYFLGAAALPGGQTGAKPHSVVHLVIWFAAFALPLLWLKAGELRAGDRLFIGLVGLLLLAVFYAIFLRVRQYGLTPNRWFVVAGALWLSLAYALVFWGKDCRIGLWALVGLIIVGVWTPLGAVGMSVRSQLGRFERLEKIPQNREELVNIRNFLLEYDVELGADIAESVTKGLNATVENIPHWETSGYVRLEPTKVKSAFDVSGFDCAFLDIGRKEEHVCGDIEARSGKEGNPLRILYRGEEQLAIDWYEKYRAELPRDNSQSQVTYTIPEEGRWVRLETADLDIAVWLKFVDIRVAFLSDGSEEPKDADFDYHVFVRKRGRGGAEAEPANAAPAP